MKSFGMVSGPKRDGVVTGKPVSSGGTFGRERPPAKACHCVLDWRTARASISRAKS